MYDTSKIMKRAWEIMGETYNFPASPFSSIGRKCFAGCLKHAWAEAKQAASIAAIPQAEKRNQIASLRSQIEQLKYKSFRYDIGAMARKLQTQIETLETA